MKILLTLALLGTYSFQALALSPAESEKQYQFYTEGLLINDVNDIDDLFDGTKLSKGDQKILVDSLWDIVAIPANVSRLDSTRRLWRNLNFKSMKLSEQLRLYLIGLKIGGATSRLDAMKATLLKTLKGKLEHRTLIIVLNHSETLRNEGFDQNLDEIEAVNSKLKAEYNTIVGSENEILSDEEIKEIFQSNVRDTTKSFMFLVCRSDRNYPCRIIIKGINGKLVQDVNKEIWSLPALAKSKLDLTFNHENGNTPSGLYLIDSVIPSPEPIYEFGKNRRLILQMMDKTSAVKILPASQQKRNWWKQTFLTLELGRENLRIHGTGKVNTDPLTLHPALVPSLGCIKLREGTYDKIKYNDQKLLLNALMQAQGLKLNSNNEFKIKANLLVFDIPGEGPIELENVRDYLEE